MAVIGDVPGGLPPLGLPLIPRDDLGAVVVGGVSLALVALGGGFGSDTAFRHARRLPGADRARVGRYGRIECCCGAVRWARSRGEPVEDGGGRAGREQESGLGDDRRRDRGHRPDRVHLVLRGSASIRTLGDRRRRRVGPDGRCRTPAVRQGPTGRLRRRGRRRGGGRPVRTASWPRHCDRGVVADDHLPFKPAADRGARQDRRREGRMGPCTWSSRSTARPGGGGGPARRSSVLGERGGDRGAAGRGGRQVGGHAGPGARPRGHDAARHDGR